MNYMKSFFIKTKIKIIIRPNYLIPKYVEQNDIIEFLKNHKTLGFRAKYLKLLPPIIDDNEVSIIILSYNNESFDFIEKWNVHKIDVSFSKSNSLVINNDNVKSEKICISGNIEKITLNKNNFNVIIHRKKIIS